MARLLTEGFEIEDGQNMDSLIVQGSGFFGNDESQADDSYPAQNPVPYTGKQCFMIGSDRTLTYDFENDIGGAILSDCYVAFWCYVRTNNGNFVQFSVAQNNYDGIVKLLSNGDIQVYRENTLLASAGAATFAFNQWNHVQVYYKPLNAGGEITVYLNGASVVTFSGDTTNLNEAVYEVNFAATSQFQSNGRWFLDDLVIQDSSGTANNSYPGMVRLYPMRVVTNGDNTQLTRAGDDYSSNAAQIRTNGRTAVVQSSTTDQYDLYTVDIPNIGAGETIKNVVVKSIATVDAGAGNIALGIKTTGGEDWGSDQALGNAFTHYEEVWNVNPDDSLAWEEADLTGLQIGVKIR